MAITMTSRNYLYFSAVNAEARIALSITLQASAVRRDVVPSMGVSRQGGAAMRLLGCLIAAVCVSLLQCPCAAAQTPGEHSADAQSAPVHQHHDKHHGHDHVYPDRGAIYHELPRGAVAVHHAGLSYKFSDGVWFESRGQAFIVVAPAIGAVVMELPPFVTQVENGGETYLYANDIFYQARPDLGGYEVVNDPDEVMPPATATTTAPAPPAVAPTAAAPPAPAASVNPAPAAMTAATLSGVAAGAAVATPAVATALPAPAAVPAAAVTSAPVATAAPRGVKATAVPKNGQSPDVQARDHYECYKFAVAHSGFDPMHVNGAAAATQVAEQQSAYERAQATCFEGRGYTVQ
jgi:hypothetical protein